MKIKIDHIEKAVTFCIFLAFLSGGVYFAWSNTQESHRADAAFRASCISNGGVVAWNRCMRKDLFIELDKK